MSFGGQPFGAAPFAANAGVVIPQNPTSVTGTGLAGTVTPSVVVSLSGVLSTAAAGGFAAVGPNRYANFNFTAASYAPPAANAVNFKFGGPGGTLLTGVSSATAAGTISVLGAPLLTGNGAVSGLGSVAAVLASGITGSSSATAAGNLAPAQASTGNATTAGAGAVGTQRTLQLSGNAFTGNVNALTPTQALSGNAFTGNVGGVGFSFSFTLGGNPASGFVNAVTPTQILSGLQSYSGLGALALRTTLAAGGVAASTGPGTVGYLIPAQGTTGTGTSAAVGTIGAVPSFPLTGNATSSGVGAVGFTFGFALSGVALATAPGGVTLSRTLAPSGVASASAAGTAGAALTLSITGNAATLAPGAVGLTYPVALGGVASLTAAGVVTTNTADLILQLSGNTFTGSAGALPPIVDLLLVNNVMSADTVGSLGASQAITIPISGSGAAGATGGLGNALALPTPGAQSAAAAGVLSPQLFTLLTGLPASMQVGQPGTASPLAGVATTVAAGSVGYTLVPSAPLAGVVAAAVAGVAGPQYESGLPDLLLVTPNDEHSYTISETVYVARTPSIERLCATVGQDVALTSGVVDRDINPAVAQDILVTA